MDSRTALIQRALLDELNARKKPVAPPMAPIVNVDAPPVFVDAPSVTVAAPVVHVAAPMVHSTVDLSQLAKAMLPLVEMLARTTTLMETLRELSVPQPIHVEAPTVTVAAPIVNVDAPTVNVAAPAVTVAAPTVTVKAPDVHVVVETMEFVKAVAQMSSSLDLLMKSVADQANVLTKLVEFVSAPKPEITKTTFVMKHFDGTSTLVEEI